VILAAALTSGALAVPASAQALTVAVTGDDGVPVALAGQTIRNMAPSLIFAPTGTEVYSVAVIGPSGTPATFASTCTSSTTPRSLTYQGNGRYAVYISVYANDAACASAPPAPAPAPYTFAIGAGVAIASDPNTPLLTREPGEYATIEHRFPITGNPGADTYDVNYSTNPALAPDGNLVGPSQPAFVDAATATIPIRFSKPGRYNIVARARVYAGGATPWTAPLAVRVYAPFDFSSSTFPDSRGPSYRLRVRLRETSARGRVRIYVARKWSGKARYKRIGTVHIRRGGFTKRFTLRHTGKYRIRYRFEGSSTTAPGTVVEKVRVRRTVRFTGNDHADHTLTLAR
jgi:hypothetical protein